MTGAELIFPPTDRPDGFTNGDIAEKLGDPDTIVRELLQNALDAAMGARAEVDITIEDQPTDELPGYARYRDAFESAVALRQARESPPSGAEESVIGRIKAVLDQPSMRVLFCRDNGIGLDQARMTNILTDGNTDKPKGAGSQGVGHNTAFAASDLRYVLYVGRSRQEGRTHVATGGQAILAVHRCDRGHCAPRGLWRLPDADLFSQEQDNFPSDVPKLMREQVDAITDSGSVVAITGFDNFQLQDDIEALDAVKRAAALNFLVAIWQGDMEVRIQGRDTGRPASITRQGLGAVLAEIEEGGYLPETDPTNRLSGEQGRRIWQVLTQGREVLGHEVDGATVRIRMLEGETNARTQVHVFRDGMWITRRAPSLTSRSFGENKPFDAVILLGHGQLYDLVRRSEGPQHRGIDKPRLSSPDYRTMERLLQKIRARLREEAGELDSDDGYTPDDFALIRGSVVRRAQPKLRRRPRIRPPKPTPPPDPNPKPTPRPTTPNTGPTARIRSRLLPTSADDRTVVALQGQIQVQDSDQVISRLGLRIYMESGSDESCEDPIRDEWLRLKEIRRDGQTYTPSSRETPFEIVVPADSGTFTVDLDEPVSMAAVELLRLDAVRRR